MRPMRWPSWPVLRSDVIAGIPGAIGHVPDGMAASVLVGVNPVHGLYASIAGTIVGGATVSTRRMVVTTTSAAALAAGSALTRVSPADRPAALFLLTVVAGLAMVVAGLARFGRYVRFVSYSVMLGFITGVACNIILGQLADLTGTQAIGRTAVQRGIWVLTHPGQIDAQSLVTGLLAIAIAVTLQRTRLSSIAALLAIVVPTVIAALAGWGLEIVADAGAFPTGIPMPAMPSLRLLSTDLIVGALSVAVIVLIQGSGVAETAPNLDGSRTRTNRDFIGQGAGNIAAGLLQGQPVGGSVGQTALNLAVGAKDRWASIASGIWMIVIVLAFSEAVSKVAMTTLAGLLIVAAMRALQPRELRTIWHSGLTSQIALGTTFIATLALPIAAAVGISVALSLLLQLNQEAMDLRVVELEVDPTGRLIERAAPKQLPSQRVTMLDAYGSLLYAGARTLQRRLPDPTGAEHAAVVLRVRGRTSLGATFFAVLRDYAARVDAGGGRVYLSGVSAELHARMRDARILDEIPNLEVWNATAVLNESSLEAYESAKTWLASV
jgi:sulfate permease, SulP family